MMLDITSMQSMVCSINHLAYFLFSIAVLGIIFYYLDLEKLRPSEYLMDFSFYRFINTGFNYMVPP
jgi:hypothetical protein